MPIASTDEQLALQDSIREWAKQAAVMDVVRSLEPGAGGHHGVATALGDGQAAERWGSLAELGVFPEFIATEFERVMQVVFPGSQPMKERRP